MLQVENYTFSPWILADFSRQEAPVRAAVAQPAGHPPEVQAAAVAPYKLQTRRSRVYFKQNSVLFIDSTSGTLYSTAKSSPPLLQSFTPICATAALPSEDTQAVWWSPKWRNVRAPWPLQFNSNVKIFFRVLFCGRRLPASDVVRPVGEEVEEGRVLTLDASDIKYAEMDFFLENKSNFRETYLFLLCVRLYVGVEEVVPGYPGPRERSTRHGVARQFQRLASHPAI